MIIATDAQNSMDLRAYLNIFAGLVGALGIPPEFGRRRQQTDPLNARLIRNWGVSLFLDAQLNRVPYRMAPAIRSQVEEFLPDMITISGASGERALAEAALERNRITQEYINRGREPHYTELLAIPVPPDLSPDECRELFGRHPEDQSRLVTRWAIENGLDGILGGYSQLQAAAEVAAEHEISDFGLVACGIRRREDMNVDGGDATGTKYDICTPGDARLAGATGFLVGKTLTSVHVNDKAAAYIELVEDWQAVAC